MVGYPNIIQLFPKIVYYLYPYQPGYQYQNPLYYPVISNPPSDDTETMVSQGNHPQMALFQVFFGWWVILIQLELYFFSEMTMNNNGIC